MQHLQETRVIRCYGGSVVAFCCEARGREFDIRLRFSGMWSVKKILCAFMCTLTKKQSNLGQTSASADTRYDVPRSRIVTMIWVSIWTVEVSTTERNSTLIILLTCGAQLTSRFLSSTIIGPFNLGKLRMPSEEKMLRQSTSGQVGQLIVPDWSSPVAASCLCFHLFSSANKPIPS